jgi:SpoVK/Ycf46/Vps4 family AAA+-type ATPase
MLCNSHIGGYSLQDKTWGEFAVDHIKEVDWNDDAFQHLILPKGHKDLIHAFVDSQLTLKSSFNDVVKGKGMGLTILLAGMPGTGKTLTAEAVADQVRRPLYILSAGELGQDAHTLEMKLQQVLDLAVKWRAVLLLDECDVFMAKRSQQHLEHNEIVAVFLR